MRKKRGASLHRLLATIMPRKDGGTQAVQPITSACVGCHVQDTAKLHYGDNDRIERPGKLCDLARVGRAFAVGKVHQR